MSQAFGPLHVDDGIRVAVPSRSSRTDESRVEQRARSSSAGAWSEDLGVEAYGQEDWILPGMGEPSPRCGEYYPDAVCPECGEVHFGTHACGRRECPHDWGVWSRDAAMRATVRLQAFRYTQPDNWRRQVTHAVYAPPEGTVQTIRAFKDMVRDAYRLAKEKGMRGGLAVPHGYRVMEWAQEEFRDAKKNGDEDAQAGVWRWVRENDTDWREQAYWSPHVHIVGFTTPDMDPGTDEDEGVWKVIRSLDRFGLRDEDGYEDVYGTVRYLLSHSTFHRDESMQVVRWFGCVANNSFTDAEKPSEGVMSVIERLTEQVADAPLEDEESDAAAPEDDDTETPDCPVCEVSMIDVFDVREYIRYSEPPPEIRRAMRTAYRWRMGEIQPPPGLKSPRTEEDAREAFDHLL